MQKTPPYLNGVFSVLSFVKLQTARHLTNRSRHKPRTELEGNRVDADRYAVGGKAKLNVTLSIILLRS